MDEIRTPGERQRQWRARQQWLFAPPEMSGRQRIACITGCKGFPYSASLSKGREAARIYAAVAAPSPLGERAWVRGDFLTALKRPHPSNDQSRSKSGVGPQDQDQEDARAPQSSKQWLERQLNDPYVAAAKREGYRSRAAYKLEEIAQKYHFLKPAVSWSTLARPRAAGARSR